MKNIFLNEALTLIILTIKSVKFLFKKVLTMKSLLRVQWNHNKNTMLNKGRTLFILINREKNETSRDVVYIEIILKVIFFFPN